MGGPSSSVAHALDLGAFDQLLLALEHPDAKAWRNVAEVAAIPGGNQLPLWIDDVVDAVDKFALHEPPALAALRPQRPPPRGNR